MSKNRLNKRVILKIALLVVLTLLLATFAFFVLRDTDESKTGTTSDGQPVNLEPATVAEQAETDRHKDDILEQERQANISPNSATGKKTVSVVITETSASSVRGYASGVFEEGGVCTATASREDTKVTKTSSGFQNVSYTQCAPIIWDSPLSKGQWTVTLSYKSASAEGYTTTSFEVK